MGISINYNPNKDVPSPRSGARGFNTSSGSVLLDPNVLTPISAEMLKELELDPTYQALSKSGSITVTNTAPIAEKVVIVPILSTEIDPLAPVVAPVVVPVATVSAVDTKRAK